MNIEVNVTTFPLPHGHSFGVNDFSGRRHNGYVLNYSPDNPMTEDQKSIAKIQRRMGVVAKHGGDDGYYSDKTAKYVESWQGQHGLPITGVVDQETWDAMGLYSGE